MISGIVPFEEIVQSVKDETGIENMRPLYERIKRLIFRGEREIGYGGSVVLFKKTYPFSSSTNPSVSKFIKFPEDLIELEGIGRDCKPMSECEYTPTSEGARFKKAQVKDIVLLYWGIKTDDNGYPMVTRNHEEAVIAYIVWKIYKQRIFLGIGNMNANKDYEETFISSLLEARGDDAFPTLEQWNALGELSYTDRRLMIQEPVHTYDYCPDEECNDLSNDMKVYYWQLEDLSETIESITPLLQDTVYLFEKTNENYEVFEQGIKIIYTNIAKIAFAIYQTSDFNFLINDSLNNDITDEFDTYYSEAISAMIFVSKTHRSYSTLYFKFKKL